MRFFSPLKKEIRINVGFWARGFVGGDERGLFGNMVLPIM